MGLGMLRPVEVEEVQTVAKDIVKERLLRHRAAKADVDLDTKQETSAPSAWVATASGLTNTAA